MYKQVTLPVAEAVAYVRKRLDSQPPQPPIIDRGYYKEKYGLEEPPRS